MIARPSTSRSTGQSGMTMIETLLAVMLSALMILPMAGWASFAMREQSDVRDRNLSGASLGILRTSFQRDVSNASAAWVEGKPLSECSAGAKGERTLLMLADGDQRIAYALVPDDGFVSTLWRVECRSAGSDPIDSSDLATDVIDAGSKATCATAADLATAAAAAGVASTKRKSDVVAAPAADATVCRRVTLQLTTAQLDQVALTAMLRSGDSAQLADAEPPLAVATASPTTGLRRLTVQFRGTESTDPAGDALTYSWDFGDGTTSTDAAPEHGYVAVGTFTATLTVTNSSELSTSTSLAITVQDNAPVAVIASPASGSSAVRGTAFSFSSDGSNDDKDKEWGGRLVAYRWTFGDGTTSTAANPTKTYTTLSPAGGYTVTLTVTDDAGNTASTERQLPVVSNAPTAVIAAPTTGTVLIRPSTVSFSSSGSNDDKDTSYNGKITGYSWDFGDGTTSTAANPTKTYSTVGPIGGYTVRLTVTDDTGRTGTAEIKLSITSNAPVAVIAAPATGTSIVRGGTLSFSSTGSNDTKDKSYNGKIAGYSWDFGDGTTSTAASPTKTYTTLSPAGGYTVTLTVTDDTGQTGTASIKVTVANQAPTAVIAAPATGSSTYRGVDVAFSSSGSNDSKDAAYGGVIVGYTWNFGDGTTSTAANPTKTYTTRSPAGGYTVTLTVTDDSGGTASTTIKVVVANRLPSVTITASALTGTTPFVVSLGAVVVDETSMTTNPPLTYAWNFGDSTTSTLANPTKTYSTTGTRTVTLTVTDDAGATASTTATITVNAPLLAAPTGLAKTSGGTSAGKRFINFSWTAVTGAAQYEVSIQCVSVGCTDTFSNTSSGSATTVKVSGLQNATLSYDAKVRTKNSTGQWGPWSATVRVSQ